MIGKSRLAAFAAAVEGDLRGAALAAGAELAGACWDGPDDAQAAFPTGTVEGHRVTINLDERHCLVADINYGTGIALIVSAGRAPHGAVTPTGRSRTRR